MGLQLLSALLLGSAAKRSVDWVLSLSLELVWLWVEKEQKENKTVDKANKRAFILFVSSLLIYALEPSIQLLHQKHILQPVLTFVLDNAALVEA